MFTLANGPFNVYRAYRATLIGLIQKTLRNKQNVTGPWVRGGRGWAAAWRRTRAPLPHTEGYAPEPCLGLSLTNRIQRKHPNHAHAHKTHTRDH